MSFRGKIVIAVDFDGTITYKSKYPEIGMIRPDALEYLPKIAKLNTTLVLWTCRSGKELIRCLDFLRDKGLYDLFNWQYSLDRERRGIMGKVIADLYVDDKSYPIGSTTKDAGNSEIDWEKVYRYVLSIPGSCMYESL